MVSARPAGVQARLPPARPAGVQACLPPAVSGTASPQKKTHKTSPRLQGLHGSIPDNFPYLHVSFGLRSSFVHVIDDEAEFDRGLARSVLIGACRWAALLTMASMHACMDDGHRLVLCFEGADSSSTWRCGACHGQLGPPQPRLGTFPYEPPLSVHTPSAPATQGCWNSRRQTCTERPERSRRISSYAG